MNTLAKIRKLKNAFYNLNQLTIEWEKKCLELERERQEMFLDEDFKEQFKQLEFDLKTLTDFLNH